MTLTEYLRWQASDPTDPGSASRASMARTFAWLYGSGATLVLATLLLPGAPERFAPGIAGAALAAYIVVLAMVRVAERIPGWLWAIVPGLGTLLVTVVVLSGGQDGLAGYAFMYLWVVLAAFYFFPRAWALLNLALVLVALSVALGVHGETQARGVVFLMAGGALAVAGMLISVLRERVDGLIVRLRSTADHQAAVAVIGERALEGADPAQVMDGVAHIVVDQLGARGCEVVETLADGGRLVRAGAGPTARPRGTVTEQPMPGTALAVTIPGGDHPFGELAVTSAAGRSLGDEDQRFLQSLANVVAGAVVRRTNEDELARQARHDLLTGLPNRVLLVERLQRALERSQESGRGVGLFFIDVDGFKAINDGFGHAAGDELLVALVPRLREALVLTDTVARFGGDEYVVLCEDVDGPEEALAIGEALRAAASRPMPLSRVEHRGTVSIGVTVAAGTGVALETLLREADAAMYRAKALGRDRCVLFDDSLHADVLARARTEQALRGACEREELALVYQPIFDLSDGTLTGVEALLRWNSSELGEISPADFIPLAEQCGLMREVGGWVLTEACARAATWRAQLGVRAPLPIHVNVSACQLGEPDFGDEVAATLAATGARPGDISLEITETALMEDAEGVAATLRQLRRLGCTVALDDFGTGFSSLGYLDRFPLDTLKIDRSFVAPLGSIGGDAAVVRAMIGLARNFGLNVVAEGIETPAQAGALRELGCRQGQGFLYARPLDAAAVEAMVGGGEPAPAPAPVAAAA